MIRAKENPLKPFIDHQGWMLIDGGLATALEAHGANLDNALWSASVLLDSPESLREVHAAFLGAGADCITTATYQATLEGFRQRGIDAGEAMLLFQLAVRLACEARDVFWSGRSHPRERRRPLVAGSVGPYGAYLADGSEYRGDYGLSSDELYRFHRPRWRILAATTVDLLACETIPSLPETEALMRLLDETPERWAWVSFSCGDNETLCDGSALARAIALCEKRPNLAAIGVNCTSPERIAALLGVLREHTQKPILVYPNSGETYDASSKAWVAGTRQSGWVKLALDWKRLGATVFGGCCRTTPAEISDLRRILAAGG